MKKHETTTGQVHSFGGLMLFLVIVGIVLGVSGTFIVKWLWTYIKPWLHTFTA